VSNTEDEIPPVWLQNEEWQGGHAERLIASILPSAPSIGEILAESAAPEALADIGVSVAGQPEQQTKPPKRRKREFSGRIAQMRKEAQKGKLPSTEDLESIILAIALRTVNCSDPKRSKEGLDLLLQVYAKRTTAKHAPGNRPKTTAAADEQV
jgi:hypothetical protein